MHIDHNSYGTLGLVFLISAVVVVALFLLSGSSWLSWSVFVVALVFCVWQTSFHIVPQRKCVLSEGEVVSVADGRERMRAKSRVL